MAPPRALLFDVFGTSVDWRSSVIAEGEALAGRLGLEGVDWPALADVSLDAVPAADRTDFNLVWHRLAPWPDTVEGLRLLKGRFIIAPNSNGHIARAEPVQARRPAMGRDPRV